MVTVTCVHRSCGVVFGIPEHIEQQARRDHERGVICPNGHTFIYKDSEPDRLRKRIAELEETVNRWKAAKENEEQRTARAERRVSYWKGIAHRKPR